MTIYEIGCAECEAVAGGMQESACAAWADNVEYVGAVVGGIVGTLVGRVFGGIVGTGVGGIIGGYAGRSIYDDCMNR